MDISYSIQTSGFIIGTPAIFISVPPKDTSKGEESLDIPYLELKKYDCKDVIITGNDPSHYNLVSSINYLRREGYFVVVETNGDYPNNIVGASWVILIPDDLSRIYDIQTKEVLIIVEKPKKPATYEKQLNSTIKTIKKFISDNDLSNWIYIQPKNDQNKLNKKNIKFCADIVMAISDTKLDIKYEFGF